MNDDYDYDDEEWEGDEDSHSPYCRDIYCSGDCSEAGSLRYRNNPLDAEQFETMLDDLLDKVREAKYLEIQAASSGSRYDGDRADEAQEIEEATYQALLETVRHHANEVRLNP